MKHLYIAKFSNGRPNLIIAQVIKETEKSYIVHQKDAQRIFGWSSYTPKRISKTDTVFASFDAAMNFLISCAKKHYDGCIQRTEEAQETFEELKDMVTWDIAS